MQHLEGSRTPVLYIGRTVLLKVNLDIHRIRCWMDPRAGLYPVEKRKIPALREIEIQLHNLPVRGLVSKTTESSQLACKAPYQRLADWADPSRSATISQRITGYISAKATLKFTYFYNYMNNGSLQIIADIL